jgi:hypothetical protein
MARRLGAAWWWAVGAAVALTTWPAQVAAQVRTVANLVVGDGVMVIKAGPGKHVYVGAAGAATRTVTLTLDAAAVDDFVVDARALVARGTRPLPPHASDRPEIQETESPRALSVTRHVERAHAAAVVTYHIFVSDEKLGGFALSTSPVEMQAILLAFHRAARAANVLSAPPDTTHHARRPPTTAAQATKPAPAPAAAPQRGPN